MTTPAPILQTLPSGLTFEMIPVGPGRFMMGSEEEDAYIREQPVHEVRIDYSFAIGKYPVTQELWMTVMSGENPSYFKGRNRPVEKVSWFDAAVFSNALNELCGFAPVYFNDEDFQKPFGKTQIGYELNNSGPVYRKSAANGFRLPTEAEWEYAARGGQASENTKYAGSAVLDEAGWYDENSHGETKPVGLKLPNELGIYDMSGNLWEWCEDHWHNSYEVGVPNDGSAWIDRIDGGIRILRGGSFRFYSKFCSCSDRYNDGPKYRNNYFGFRLVLFPLPV